MVLSERKNTEKVKKKPAGKKRWSNVYLPE